MSLPRYRTRLVHLAAVWAYGVSQPLLTVIDGNPDLLLSRGLTRLEVAVFAILVALVPPLFAIGYVWVAGRFSPWAGDLLFLVLLGAGLAPLAARAVKLVDVGLLVAGALVSALALAGVLVYRRSRAARLFLGYSIVLPVVGLVWFVHGLPPLTEDAEAAQVRVSSPAPVVFLLLDELPASSLMTRAEEVDRVRYPNFARLARDGTWYRNATTVHEWTSDAVPAILTGRVIKSKTLATVDNYPENLFTLLGGTYSLDVHEAYATRLCPTHLCPKEQSAALRSGVDLFVDSFRLLLRRNLPRSVFKEIATINDDIALQEESSVSIREFDEFLGEISAGASSTLYFDHLLLPHAPWTYLPSGIQYEFKGLDGWLPSEHWKTEPWPVLQGFQRHLLQLGYTDRLLGRLLNRLDRNGLYDGALIVVVADHGVSFRAGEGRRPVTDDNLADIANVPLFVKYPRQRQGRVDSRAARTVDLVPTIADVLGIRLPWRTDGVSLRSAPVARGVLVDQRGGDVRRASLAAMLRDRALTLRRKVASFGEGRDSLYGIGANRWLLGRETASVRTGSATVQVRIDNRDALLAVRRASGFVPARISGRVTSGRLEPGAELAVAVNGRVQALTRCFWSNGVQRFRAMVPESALRDGANDVDVFLARRDGRKRLVVAVGELT